VFAINTLCRPTKLVHFVHTVQDGILFLSYGGQANPLQLRNRRVHAPCIDVTLHIVLCSESVPIMRPKAGLVPACYENGEVDELLEWI
jgi:hypothetical protein